MLQASAEKERALTAIKLFLDMLNLAERADVHYSAKQICTALRWAKAVEKLGAYHEDIGPLLPRSLSAFDVSSLERAQEILLQALLKNCTRYPEKLANLLRACQRSPSGKSVSNQEPLDLLFNCLSDFSASHASPVVQPSLRKACAKHCMRQARQCLWSENNGMLILPLPRLDADPASLIALLGLDRFSSLAHFAGHIMHSRALQTTYSLAASLHALAYFSGPADQRLAVANVLFGAPTAGAQVTPKDGTDRAIGAACDSLVQRGQQGAALALELLCLKALSAERGTIINRLVQACRPPHEMCSAPGISVLDTSRLPLHLEGERQLSGSEKQLPGTSGGKTARESDQGRVQHAEPVPAGSEEDGLQAQDRKRARLEARDAIDGVPATAESAAREPDAVAQEAVKIVEQLLTRAHNPDALGKRAELQAAVMAVHPALMAEMAGISFQVCCLYLRLCLRHFADSSEMGLCSVLHMLRMGGRIGELTKLALTSIYSGD